MKEDLEVIPVLMRSKVGHTAGSTSPTLFEQLCGFFYIIQEPDKSESAVRRDLRFFLLIGED